jgi:hypothetical protein
MGTKLSFAATAVAAALVLSSCSKAPETAAKVETEAKKEAPKAPEAVAAQAPYYEMYKMARTWTPDVLGLTLKNGEVPGVKNVDGKAGLWTAVFVSPSLKQARTFTYAVTDAEPDIHKGVTVSGVQVWGGATPAAKAFVNAEFLVNSDAAYKTAAEKAAEWLKTHQDAKVTMILGNSSRFPAPVWYILWGTTKNGYVAFVNATTGTIVTR